MLHLTVSPVAGERAVDHVHSIPHKNRWLRPQLVLYLVRCSASTCFVYVLHVFMASF